MSDLLNQASLVYIPSGYKEDTAYSVIPTDGSGDLTFTRASDGTRVNSQGLVERVPWNLLQYSNTFSNAIWTKGSSITVTSGQTGYDGSSNAWLLSKSAIQYPSIGQSLVNSGFTTLSVYAKANTNTNICLFASSSPSNKYQDFNLSNGTLGTNASGVVNATITSVGSGWYFCVVTFNGNTTTFDIFPDIIDGTNAGSIYIQNAQVNIGSTTKPYFPTTDRQNVPRLDYSNGCPSLLLEPQRTNLTLYSEQIDNAVHNYLGVAITANNITSPDGTQTADKITETTATSEHIIYDNQTNTTGTYTLSAFFKEGAGTIYPVLRLNGSDTAAYAGCIFNTSTGAVVNTFYSNYSAPSTKVENMGNGWYRVSMTTTTTNTNFGMRIAASNSTSPSIGSYGAISYTGSTSNYFYAWGAQLEAGSYPTSYIPTTSASVTRVADEASKTGISSLIGQTEGTMFVDFVVNGIQNAYANLINSEKNTTNSFYIHLGLDTIVRAGVFANSVQVELNASGFVIGQRYKLAFAYKTGESAIYSNGVQKATSANSFTFNSSLDDIFLNDPTTYFGYQENVSLNQAVLFKTRLTNAELASLTTL